MMRGLTSAALALVLAASSALPLVAQEDASVGTGAVLRGLDKMTGQRVDVTAPTGSAAMIGKLSVTLWECRYPAGNAAGDAYAFMTISEPAKSPEPIFSGWMVASSPALNALDHFRYDVWVLRCTTS